MSRLINCLVYDMGEVGSKHTAHLNQQLYNKIDNEGKIKLHCPFNNNLN